MAKVKTNKHGILVIDFRYHCIRRVLSTGLKDTKANRQSVNLKAKAMEYDMKQGRLNIKKYFPQYVDENDEREKTLAEFFEYYTKEKDVRPSTWTAINYAWNNFINPRFGHYKLTEINKHDILVFRKWLMRRSPSMLFLLLGNFYNNGDL